MGRALVIAALVLVCPRSARADSTEMHIAVTDVTIYGEGDWGLVEVRDGWELWKNASDDVRKRAQLAFSPAVAGGCGVYSDATEMTSEYAFEEDTVVYEGENNGGTVTAVCTEVGGYSYNVEATTWGGNLLYGFFEDINGMVHSYISRVRAANTPAEIDPEPSYDPGPATTPLHVPTVGLTFYALGTWYSDADNVWTLPSAGVVVTFEAPGLACEVLGAELPRDYFPEAPAERVDDLGTVDGVQTIRVCLLVAGHAYPLSIAVAEGAALDEIADMLVRYEADLVRFNRPDAVRTPRAWVWPHTIAVAVVQRSDGEASAWGAGLALTRRPWHVERHLALGYALDLTLASGWFSGAAMVRPGIWAGNDMNSRTLSRKGLIGDLYLALGVDGTTGDQAPSTGVTPTFGAGFELTLLTAATSDLGVGLDASVQILADPSGFHSDTEELAFLSGKSTARMLRFGFRHVGDPATGSVWWFTLGVVDARNDR